MANHERMFLAIWADEVAGAVSQLRDRLAAADAEISWMAPEQLHVTVKFLGDTTLLQAAKICQVLQRTAHHYEPTDLEIRGLGAFPRLQRPRTLWVGMGRGAEWLEDLHADIDDELADLRFQPDARFTPHITVGRVRSGRNVPQLAPLLEAEEETAFGNIGASEIALVSSRLEPQGPIYEVVGRATLGG